MPIDNTRLIFAHGNQWIKEKDAAPFFGLPAWWRRFMFQILTPREVTVYLYLCSVMDPNAIAYPTVEQIAEDLVVKTRSVIVDALNKLVELGFLLRGEEPYRGRIMGKRIVYQRPLPHYTVLKLLQLKIIDSDLYPTENKTRNLEFTRASDDVVRSGLRHLIGAENFAAYESVKAPERRLRILTTALEQHIQSVTSAAEEALRERLAKIDVVNFIGKLSPSMRAILQEESIQEVSLDDDVPF